ncbi:hypothetical protein AB1046_18990 [Promicromonospora sp. Populi]|uniref:hypothetical protein n=1 Tax=Promicromonospora sp. Populi TaxID=3239420 RepID=UPI0034E272BD
MTDKQQAEGSLAEWATTAELRPRLMVRGEEAAAAGRALLESVGVDVVQLERSVGGRPGPGAL